MATEIYLVRHGQTEWNRDSRAQGRLDSPLTALGREQARHTGRALARLGLAGLPVAMSPLGRTRATTAILAEEVALGPVTEEPRLMELALGSWEGMTLGEIQARFARLLEGSTEHTWYFRAPDGESFDSARIRVGGWLREQTGPVLAVAHGMVGRALRAIYLDLPWEQAQAEPLAQNVIWHFHDGKLTVLPVR
ncbi:MAG: histidine phosphatase family protein [Holophaga sp.]|nr:histidine phosphatase family protein [Holophaga sp.]